MNHNGAVWLPLALTLTIAGCSTKSDLEELKQSQALLKSNQNEIKYNQKKMLEQLEAIEAKLTRPAAPTPARAPAQPDPAKTYALQLGDAPSKGPKDAWVTIAEISDFQ